MALFRSLAFNKTIVRRLSLTPFRAVSSARNSAGEEDFSGQAGRQNGVKYGAVALATGALGYAYYKRNSSSPVLAASKPSETAGSIQNGLPTYTKAEVAQHKTMDKKIWVTYRNGVYDITDYVAQHPGGKRILLGAGGAIDAYWNMYAAHKKDEIFEILELYRIGNITEVDIPENSDENDPYVNDPKRHPALIPSSKKPFNAEPPVSLLLQEFITPNDLFFVRNHLPVPNVKPNEYQLEISFEGPGLPKALTLDALKKKFKKKTVTTTLQCAGNRRSDMTQVKPVKGLDWGFAAISTANWAGPTLNDVFLHFGIDIEKVDCEHIHFEGMDTGPDGTIYAASIPIELARMMKNDIVVAYEMNGEAIPRDHGYPVRIIIPGVVGARQVKWLNKIILSKKESEGHWQQRDYKGFNASVDWHNVDFSKSEAIHFLPVQSAICEPENGTVLEDNEEVTVKGYAWSGGGRGIYRVDVSADGGKTWVTADLESNGQSPYKAWAWRFWEVSVPLPEDSKGKSVELICKACDSQYNVQPDNVAGIWNLRGCLSNAWHRIHVDVPK